MCVSIGQVTNLRSAPLELCDIIVLFTDKDDAGDAGLISGLANG